MTSKSTTLELRIETDPQECVLVFDDTSSPDGADVCSATVTRYAVGLPETLLAIATLTATVPVNLFSSWLYEKLKSKKPNQLYINGQQVELNEKSILTFIEQQMTKHNGKNCDIGEQNPNS